MLVEGAPDGLRVDRDEVCSERDEIISGRLRREVSRLSVHDVVGVHLAQRAAWKMILR